jgi:GNAT superfamily N-acetyltransferase
MTTDFQPEFATLRDGTTVTLRAIRPDDGPRLQALFYRLSPESVYLRFLQSRKSVTDQEATVLATVDYQRRMAMVATIQDAHSSDELVIGVARYAALEAPRSDVAEAAIVVEDAYQRKGLGKLLADRLAEYARAHGIQTFLAEVSLDNMRMIEFIRRTGLPVKSKLESGVWELRVGLEDSVEDADKH